MDNSDCPQENLQKSAELGSETELYVRPDYDIIKWANPCYKAKEDKPVEEGEGNLVDSFDIRMVDLESIDQVLASIVPPRRWFERGTQWEQHVSSEAASRGYVRELSNKVKNALAYTHRFGIDEMRRCIYSELFTEMVRQVTIRNVNRGLLLLRVRDDIKMTIETFLSTCVGGVEFGREKALSAEDVLPGLVEEVEKWKDKKRQAEELVEGMRREVEEQENTWKEWRDRAVAKHKRRVDFLKATNEALQNQWDLITAWKPQNLDLTNFVFDSI